MDTTAVAAGAERDADEGGGIVDLIAGRIERLRADALGQLGRIHASGVDDDELADLIEQADAAGILGNTRWDPRVMMQLRAIRILLHRPTLEILSQTCAGLMEPEFLRRRVLEDIRATAVFEGLPPEQRQGLEAWAPGIAWREIASNLGEILDKRFASRRAGTVTRARPLAAVRRPPPAAKPQSDEAAAQGMRPADWTRDDIRTRKRVTRLSPLLAHLLESLALSERSGCDGSALRRLLIELGCIDGWLQADRGMIQPHWLARLREAERHAGQAAVSAWPGSLRGTTRVRYSAGAPVGRATAALAAYLWRRRALDATVIAETLSLSSRHRSAPSVAKSTTQCSESDQRRARCEVFMPNWLVVAADQAITNGRLRSSSRSGAIAEALEAWPALQGVLEGTFGQRAGLRLSTAFSAPPARNHFLTGRLERVLIDTAERRYGDGLREALERVILLEAAAVGLFNLSTVDLRHPDQHEVEARTLFTRLEALAGRRPAALIRQAIEAAGPRLTLSISSSDELRIAVGA